MSSSSPLLLYDIASGPPVHPYAPNPWKARYALNFKRAPFKTEWVDLSEVASMRQSLGAAPVRFHSDGRPYPTLPVLKDPSGGTVIGDSFDIAVWLEKKYPEGPRLFRQQQSIGIYAAFNAHMDSVFPAGAALCGQGIPFNPATEAKCKAAMCERIGVKSWEDLLVHGEKRREVLAAYQGALGEVAKFFRFAEGAGPFIGGEEADYADIIIGGWLMMLSLALPEAEWEEIRGWHGGLWGRLHDGLEPYRETW